MHLLTAWCRASRLAFQVYLPLLEWFVAEHLFASNLRDLRSADSNSERAAISMGDGVVRLNVRVTILIAITSVLVFATPAYMRDASRSTQEEQTKPPKTKSPTEPPPRVIAMTAKDFQFDPAEIHLKVGEKVRLQVISSDRTHGIHISAFPDAAKANTPPGLSFIFGEDCWKLRKGEVVPFDIEATEPGTYSFRCCKSCGTGQKQMTGRIYVEP